MRINTRAQLRDQLTISLGRFGEMLRERVINFREMDSAGCIRACEPISIISIPGSPSEARKARLGANRK